MPRFGKEQEQELSIITPVLRTYRFIYRVMNHMLFRETS